MWGTINRNASVKWTAVARIPGFDFRQRQGLVSSRCSWLLDLLPSWSPRIHRGLSSPCMQLHGVVLEHRIAGTFIAVLSTVFYRGAPLSCHYWEANPKSMLRTNVHTKPLTLLLCWRKFPSKYWVSSVLTADGNCINTQYTYLGSKANQLHVSSLGKYSKPTADFKALPKS
jgi:hypothetical protein